MGKLVALAEKEIVRKEILMLCQEAGELGCSQEVLNAALKKYGFESGYDLNTEIMYLEEKGLVSVRTINNIRLDIKRKVIRITAKGIDYLDGNGEDITGIGV